MSKLTLSLDFSGSSKFIFFMSRYVFEQSFLARRRWLWYDISDRKAADGRLMEGCRMIARLKDTLLLVGDKTSERAMLR